MPSKELEVGRGHSGYVTWYVTQNQGTIESVVVSIAYGWRKLVGVEPTRDTVTAHAPDLKSGPSTGQD